MLRDSPAYLGPNDILCSEAPAPQGVLLKLSDLEAECIGSHINVNLDTVPNSLELRLSCFPAGIHPVQSQRSLWEGLGDHPSVCLPWCCGVLLPGDLATSLVHGSDATRPGLKDPEGSCRTSQGGSLAVRRIEIQREPAGGESRVY